MTETLAGPVQPFGLTSFEPQLLPGDPVEMAGYGLTESGTVGELRSSRRISDSVDANLLRVKGRKVSGACGGDSGGPLIVRGVDGAPVIAGVLSTGSPTCVDRDSYQRLAPARDWITNMIAPDHPPSSLDCGALAYQGRCLYRNAVWCENAQLVADVCETGRRADGYRTQCLPMCPHVSPSLRRGRLCRRMPRREREVVHRGVLTEEPVRCLRADLSTPRVGCPCPLHGGSTVRIRRPRSLARWQRGTNQIRVGASEL